jgi:hypothetical protein
MLCCCSAAEKEKEKEKDGKKSRKITDQYGSELCSDCLNVIEDEEEVDEK